MFECNQEDLKTDVIGKGFDLSQVWGKDKEYKELDFVNEDAENKTDLKACIDYASSEESRWKRLFEILCESSVDENIHAEEKADMKEQSDIQPLISQKTPELSDEDSDSMDEETIKEALTDRKKFNEKFGKKFELFKKEMEKRRARPIRCTVIKRATPNYSSTIKECQIIQEFLIVLELLRTALGRRDLNPYDLELNQATGHSSIIFKIHHTSAQPSLLSKMTKALKQYFKSDNAHCVFDLKDDVLKLIFKINSHELSFFESEESRKLIFDCLNSSVHDILKSSLKLSPRNEIDVVNEILDADLDELLWSNWYSCQKRMAYTDSFDAKDTTDFPGLDYDTVSYEYDFNAGEKLEDEDGKIEISI